MKIPTSFIFPPTDGHPSFTWTRSDELFKRWITSVALLAFSDSCCNDCVNSAWNKSGMQEFSFLNRHILTIKKKKKKKKVLRFPNQFYNAIPVALVRVIHIVGRRAKLFQSCTVTFFFVSPPSAANKRERRQPHRSSGISVFDRLRLCVFVSNCGDLIDFDLVLLAVSRLPNLHAHVPLILRPNFPEKFSIPPSTVVNWTHRGWGWELLNVLISDAIGREKRAPSLASF